MSSCRWARKKLANAQGFFAIDILLALVILACLGGIASQLIQSTHGKREITLVEAAPPQPPPSLNSPSPDSDRLPVVSDETWKQIMTDPVLRAARRLRSEACSSSFERLQWGLPTNHQDRIRQIQALRPQVISVADKDICFELGQQIQIVTFDRAPDAPVVQHLATMSIFDILYFDDGNIPRALQNLEALSSNIFLRLQPATLEEQDQTLAPPFVRHGKVVFKTEYEAFRKKYPEVLIIDVRSPREFAAKTIPGAINVPIVIAPRSSNSFSWTVLNKDIAGTKFDLQQIERLAAGKPVVVFGGPPSDGRAFWAAHFLSDLSIPNLFFFYEGL